MKQAIDQLKSDARNLSDNHHTMTAQAVYTEASILWGQLLLLRDQLATDTQIDFDELEELDSSLQDAENAMHEVEDACEYHYSHFTTQL